jgi:hypothetical protein
MSDRGLEMLARNYEAAVQRGEHDDQCEYSVAGQFFLCHCSKRRREAEGIIEVPTDNLYFAPPDCTRCGRTVTFDGDGYECGHCRLAWDSEGFGDSARFLDDHGDLAATRENWFAKHPQPEQSSRDIEGGDGE